MIFSNAYVIAVEETVLIEISSLTFYFQHSRHIRVNKVTYALIKMTFTLNQNFLIRGLQNFLLRNFDISASACSLIYCWNFVL